MSSFAELTPAQKQELATSLAVIACHDAEVELSADNLNAALSASKCEVASYMPTLFADMLARGMKVDDFLAGPSAGAAASGAGAASGDAAPAAEEKEEEEEADLGGAMDMFGGDDY